MHITYYVHTCVVSFHQHINTRYPGLSAITYGKLCSLGEGEHMYKDLPNVQVCVALSIMIVGAW